MSSASTVPVSPAATGVLARRLILTGHVQGVGFRPFVYRTARKLRLRGWVQNQLGQVVAHVEGLPEAVEGFLGAVIHDAPPLSRPTLESSEHVQPGGFEDFSIVRSEAGAESRVFVPPDYFTCDDCIREMQDRSDRRWAYPFINCTQCGPRYTLIESMPYDRPNTTMAAFALCDRCRREYEDPMDRRFHAEPIACPDCGPRLLFESGAQRVEGNAPALDAALAALRAGKIVAVKGVGGYHLMCDARSETAVTVLRHRKRRPHKPLAVMFPAGDGLRELRAACTPSRQEMDLLTDPMRPIVLVNKREDARLSRHIAPGLAEIGVFLPYSPLHHLLLDGFGGPLVATSGNLSGEPVLTENHEAAVRLAAIADGFLHHDRPIVRPADDSVYRSIGSRLRPLRLGRGIAPLELDIPWRQPAPVLAVGAHMKNTVALAWENRVVVSPHIGEMDSPRSMGVLAAVAGSLQSLYGVRAERVVCDAHPGYTTRRWALESGLPVTTVFHHHAHAAAAIGEQHDAGDGDPWLVFTWDGVGFGEDGTLWGGETLFGRPGNWQRVATLRPFHLPGGDAVGRQPWRSAAALCWETDRDWRDDSGEDALVRQAWEKRLNSTQSSAAGRLFDAAAAIVAGVQEASYEAQGPMVLEAMSHDCGALVEMPLRRRSDGLLVTDWEPLLDNLMDVSEPAEQRAACFHWSLAHAMLTQARAVAQRHDVRRIALAGGVFQNRLLTRLAIDKLEADGFDVRVPGWLPCNDAAISFGQVVEHAHQSL